MSSSNFPSRHRLRRRAAVNVWSREDVGRLRELAESGTPVQVISTILRRTESAIRNKAGMHGISLQARGLRPLVSASTKMVEEPSAAQSSVVLSARRLPVHFPADPVA